MELVDNLARVRNRMEAACARAHRPAASVRLLAVTKTVPAERIREAYALGLELFGENRVQEREAKAGALADLTASWRLIGPLQSNKAGRALALFDTIDTVADLGLAQRLDRLARAAGRRLPVLLEVNIGGEAQKYGVAPAELAALAAGVGELPGLELRGLLTVPPVAPEAEASRPYFAALADLATGLVLPAGLALPGGMGLELSMGMSHDFEVAIEEGATLVRIGSALFGERR